MLNIVIYMYYTIKNGHEWNQDYWDGMEIISSK